MSSVAVDDTVRAARGVDDAAEPLVKGYYLNIDDVNPSSSFDDVAAGNPATTAGGQTTKGGDLAPCLRNSEQIAAMRGYDSEVVGNLEDLLKNPESITPGTYKVQLKTRIGYQNHWVVADADGTVTDVSKALNLEGGVSSNTRMEDTWELHDYYENELGYKSDELVEE